MGDWQQRVDAVWAMAYERAESETLAAIEALVAERPSSDPNALFEAAGARDFVGREAEAEPLYREALAGGLPEPWRGQAVIQLASTLRNLGHPAQAMALLNDMLRAHPAHELRDAARAFLALALLDLGRSADAVREALHTLAPHLPLYGRAVSAYADEAAAQEAGHRPRE